ncbi:MAG: hypothetical protein K8R68_00810 [Bacteroidales bacterium]|nr:hypothetical protein [Bacteroidales bacterium]
MSKKQFTYLIGAGASAQKIPVINNFSDGLTEFAEYIEQVVLVEDSFHDSFRIDQKPSEIKARFIKEINWLAKECKEHSSVDTFARKLYLSNRKKELIKLKAIVSEFLLTKQIQNGIDKRYDAFFAALLDKEHSELTLPNNIKILSWNYDKQIEYSIAQFKTSHDNGIIDNFLQLFPRADNTSFDPQKFCLFKLNGAIGGTIKSNDGGYAPLIMDFNLMGDKITEEIEQNIIKNMMNRFYFIEQRIFHIAYYNKETHDDYPTIQYSWENNPLFDSVRNNALTATKETEILIIIGYSFPTFNRTLDKKLLQNMGYLRKVFVQSPQNTIKGVVQRFKSIYEFTDEIEIEEITNVDEFYIPFEY